MAEIPTLDPAEIYRNVTEAGEEWADKKAAYEALDDNTKSILADIASGFMPDNSKTASEALALASRPFRDHLAEKAIARKAWLLAQVRYDSIKMLAELRRTQESTRRAEMGMR